ncbi:MAG: HAMP domain-containing histidine kinase, partial [Clostridiales bacterium]|nr:HAMP domain-containing histidine kinase [Clostridiales bacterium]
KKHALDLVKKLEEADKNKDKFISVLSHELRNPLAAILAGVQMLDITQDADLVTKSKEVIKRQTNKLCRLVDDLLELTRITRNKINLKKKNIDLNETVKNAAGDIIHEYERKGVKLEIKVQTEPIFLDADPLRIAQTVENILSNALKFTQENGTVRLTLKKEKNYAVINIKDNGIGISPEILPHLFTPFTQADDTLDRSNGGLGLGLSIVKGIVDLHGGAVDAYSDGLGKGSTFTIRLPITAYQ